MNKTLKNSKKKKQIEKNKVNVAAKLTVKSKNNV